MATDPQNFLQAMYKEQCDQARQHETLRERSTAIIISVCAPIITFTGVAATFTYDKLEDKRWFAAYAIIGLFLIGLGWFGRGLSLKHYERNRVHAVRAGAYRSELEKLFLPAPYGQPLRQAAAASHLQQWKIDTSDKKGTIVLAHLYTY
jgi:hypothetical protein